MMTTQDRAIWRSLKAHDDTPEQIDASICAYSARVTDVQLQQASRHFLSCGKSGHGSVRRRVMTRIRYALDNGQAHLEYIAI